MKHDFDSTRTIMSRAKREGWADQIRTNSDEYAVEKKVAFSIDRLLSVKELEWDRQWRAAEFCEYAAGRMMQAGTTAVARDA